MTAIPHAAEALSSAFGRFERASARVLEAANSSPEDMSAAYVEMREARVQAKAAIGVVRFADEMWEALLELGRGRR